MYFYHNKRLPLDLINININLRFLCGGGGDQREGISAADLVVQPRAASIPPVPVCRILSHQPEHCSILQCTFGT